MNWRVLAPVVAMTACGAPEPRCASFAEVGGVEYALGPNGASPGEVAAELRVRVVRAGLCADVREDRGLVRVGVVGAPPRGVEALWAQDPGLRITPVADGVRLQALLAGRPVPVSVLDADFGGAGGSRQVLQATLGELPDSLALGMERVEAQGGWRPVFLETTPLIGPDQITAVEVKPDPIGSGSLVSLAFDEAGTRAFGAWTEANTGRKIAVQFQGRVVSQPTVIEPIPGGHAQFSLPEPQTSEQAALIAALARANPLPRPVILEAERIIGPSAN